jgi:hypothetical protein
MSNQWTVTREMQTVHLTQVFSGGACNIINGEGNLLRNQERDSINNWLTEKRIQFFDPQIHPKTHGVEYDYVKHHPLELAARRASKLRLYEVSPRSFGGITSLEIALDHFRWQEPMVIYFSDGNSAYDIIPEHSEKGHPLFVPDSIHTSETAMQAHYREFIKNANNMRKYVMGLARVMNTLTVSLNDQPADDDIVIGPERMHAADLFRALVKAASNQRVYLTFTGISQESGTRDELGNPCFIAPPDPPTVEMHTLLDQYVDEGNELRRAIAELLNVSVFVRVVYTQKSAILALEELMQIKRVTPLIT